MKKTLLFCTAITVIELIVATLLFAILPERIPMHWNMAGEIDGWGGRWTVFIIPVLTYIPLLFIAGVLSFSMKNNANSERSHKFFKLALLLEKFIFTGLFITYILAIIGGEFSIVSIDRIMFCICGVALIILGNYMPKVKQNEVAGVRTPYTLKNEVVWQKSNRFGGILFVLAGIMFIFVQLLLPSPFNLWTPIVFLCLCGVAVWVHSWWWYNKETSNIVK